MPFTKGNKLRKEKKSGIKKGDKQTKTIIKNELLNQVIDPNIKEMKDLKNSNIQKWLYLRNIAKNFMESFIVEKEIAKYIHPTNTKVSGDPDNPINVNIKVEKFL